MGMIRSAIADATITTMFVFTLPFLPILSSTVSKSLGVDPKSLSLASILITITSIAVVLFLFSTVSAALGGASFNPSTAVCFYAAGLRKPGSSIIGIALRLPAQAAGGALGVLGVMRAMPEEYRFLLRGPVLNVDSLTGAITEAILTFVQCLYLLMVMRNGPKWLIMKVWLVAATTMGLFMIGSGLTGPSMNPANAFGWAYVKNRYDVWELYYVYWAGPLIGSIMAGLAFGFLFTEPVKQKMA